MEKNKKLYFTFLIAMFALVGFAGHMAFATDSYEKAGFAPEIIYYGFGVLAIIAAFFLINIKKDNYIIMAGMVILSVALLMLWLDKSGSMYKLILAMTGIFVGILQYFITVKGLEELKSGSWNYLYAGMGAGMIGGLLIANDGKSKLFSIIILIVSVIFCVAMAVVSKKINGAINESELGVERIKMSVMDSLKQYGVSKMLICVFLYTGIEAILFRHGADYMVQNRAFQTSDAAQYMVIFILILIAARAILGLISIKVTSVKLVRFGQMIAILGIMLLLLPNEFVDAKLALVLVAFGVSPIFPNLLYQNKRLFNKRSFTTLIALEIATMNIGYIAIPLAFDIILQETSIKIMPFVVLCLLVIFTLLTEYLNTRRVKDIENQAVVDALCDQYVLIGIVGQDNRMFRFVKDDYGLMSTGIDSYKTFIETLSNMIKDDYKKRIFESRFTMKELKQARAEGLSNIEEEICLDLGGDVSIWISFMVHVTKDKHTAFTFMMKNIQDLREIKEMGQVDFATGLLSKNSYIQMINERGDAPAEGISCVYIDINDLNAINSKYGRNAGDNVISKVTDNLKEYFSDDSCYRVGGVEFVVLCEMNKEDAETAMRHMCRELAKNNISLSYGVVEGSEFMDIRSIIEIADDMMLSNKEEYLRGTDDEEE